MNELTTIWPDFAPDFFCKANLCQHSCCRGWEIDIDAAAAEWYQLLDGKIGAELRKNIVQAEDGTYSFRLTKDERCPFLRRDGLCRLILELGEDALCEICTMHPRFFVLCGNVELAGFGLACEKTVELLLAEEGPLTFYREGNEQKRITFAELVKGLGLLGEREEADRLDLFSFRPEHDAKKIRQLFLLMQKTEPIDEVWSEHLNDLLREDEKVRKCCETYTGLYETAAFDRIFQYIAYRQLGTAANYGLQAIYRYAQMSTMYIFIEAAVTENLAEAVRRWSEQIEYSEENTALLLQAAGKSKN
ncbi:flagellin lysine-N-methylase [Mitsuokella sp.]|uniref:flagellin lysine-N-methylase n=1 Tax=Mitsuokella sp. TaxID=2049034 RepID=UPI003D7F0DE2